MTDPSVMSFVAMLAISTLCFAVSTITGNASQVDKIWSITPWFYAWMAIDTSNPRSVLMAVCATVWGVRLTWNFNRRGGYEWPPWKGEEDYRWPALRQGIIPGFTLLDRRVPWIGESGGYEERNAGEAREAKLRADKDARPWKY